MGKLHLYSRSERQLIVAIPSPSMLSPLINNLIYQCRALRLPIMRPTLDLKLLQVSWTCHEHAEAWRRSSLMISAETYGVGDVDITAAAPPSGGAQLPAAKKQSASISGDKMTRAREEGETKADAPGCMGGTAATPVDDPTATVVARGDEKAGSGGKGTGMAMFAKIKGRFAARRTAAARTDVSRHKQEAGGGVEFDRAG